MSWNAAIHFKPVGIGRRLAPVISPQRFDLRLKAERDQANLTPDRYVARVVLAYEFVLLTESEFADCLGVDIVTARDTYQRCRTVELDDVRFILDLATADDRTLT